jgi:hypothetical protein
MAQAQGILCHDGHRWCRVAFASEGIEDHVNGVGGLIERFDDGCLLSAPGASINVLAEHERISASESSRRMPLIFLSPQIVRFILQGQQPIELTTSNLLRVPGLSVDWNEQAQLFGFPSS